MMTSLEFLTHPVPEKNRDAVEHIWQMRGQALKAYDAYVLEEYDAAQHVRYFLWKRRVFQGCMQDVMNFWKIPKCDDADVASAMLKKHGVDGNMKI